MRFIVQSMSACSMLCTTLHTLQVCHTVVPKSMHEICRVLPLTDTRAMHVGSLCIQLTWYTYVT